MDKLTIFAVYTAGFYALILVIAGVVSVAGGSFPGLGTMALLFLAALAGAGVGVYMHTVLAGGVTSFFGWSTGGDPGPMLAQARVFMKRDMWEDARLELDKAWVQYPGNGLVLREYERLFLEGLHAPTGMNEFFRHALPRLAPADKAYAMLRLAEVNADVLKDREEALRWCHHFLKEFPGHREADSITALATNLEKPAGKGTA
jgi:hypothetical protein